MKKILFILTVMTLCIGIVFASARLFAQGQLKNKVTANIITTRNTLSDTGNLGANFTSYIYNIYDVAGNVTTTGEITIPVGDINARVEEAGVGSATSYPTGWTNTDVTVTLPTVADIDTIYTIDGTIPTITGTKYEAPFTVSSNCSVQYIFTDGYNITSAKATEVMNIDKDLPTIVSGLAEDNRKITSICDISLYLLFFLIIKIKSSLPFFSSSYFYC